MQHVQRAALTTGAEKALTHRLLRLNALPHVSIWQARCVERQRDVDADQLLEALRAGLSDNNSQAELDAIKPQVEQFAMIFRSVGAARAGQMIGIDYTPADGTVIRLDGVVKGTIAGEAFNKALFNNWLGERPVQESLKKALLGIG